MLLTNARVYTLDSSNQIADNVVIRDGRIAFVGQRDEVNAAAGEETLDLGGQVLLPGFVDSHAHLIGLARGMMSLDVSGVRSVDEVAARVRELARHQPPGAWITGRGWDQSLWDGGAFPTHAALTAVAPGHPVSLTRVDGHASWINAAALQATGITRDTPDPAGGLILRDDAGEATGVLIDLAQDFVRAVIPEPGEAAGDAAIERAVARCLSVGLTGVQEMGIGLETVDAYKRLIERGRFPFRNYAAIMGRSRTAWPHYRERGPEMHPSGRLTVRAVKFMADGALGSRGAAMHEPYADDPSSRGLILIEPEEIERLTAEAAAAGFQPCIHAIGDRANSTVLDAFEAVLARYPDEDRRFRVEHAQILRPDDIPRFKRLGVLPSMQQTHCTSDMRWVPGRIGAERVPGSYAWRSLLNTGVVIPGGSDFPVEPPNPLYGIHAAVTRRPRKGVPARSEGDGEPPTGGLGAEAKGGTMRRRPAGVPQYEDDGPRWQPEERMTRLEAVRSFTSWAAYAAFEEDVAGTIEPGKRADLVVLDGDPFTCEEQAIADLPVTLTIVDGEVVYRRA